MSNGTRTTDLPATAKRPVSLSSSITRRPGGDGPPRFLHFHDEYLPLSLQHLPYDWSDVRRAVDPTDRTFHREESRLRSQDKCYKGAVVGTNKDRTEVIIIPLRCKSWDCPTCGPLKRAAWIQKLASGKPEREITLTCPTAKFTNATDTAQRMKRAWSKLVSQIRHTFGPFEYALVWELTHRGIPHCHVLTRGSYIPKRWLSARWTALGFGPVTWITSVKTSRLHAAHACKYLAKATGQTAIELAPLRTIQVSTNYLPKPPDETAVPDEDKMKYAVSFQTWENIVARFDDAARTVTKTVCHSGCITYTLNPPEKFFDDTELSAGAILYPDSETVPHGFFSDPSTCLCATLRQEFLP